MVELLHLQNIDDCVYYLIFTGSCINIFDHYIQCNKRMLACSLLIADSNSTVSEYFFKNF